MKTSPWATYRPSTAAPWNLARAWTLRRRAGFAATWNELQRDLRDGPEPALDRVLAGECRSDGVPTDFGTVADLLTGAAVGASDVHRLQAAWLYRMLCSPDPLLERLTLMWHDHFATSQLKVEDLAAMNGQIATFRRLGRGPFGDLVRAMLRPRAPRLARRPCQSQGQTQRKPRSRADGVVYIRRSGRFHGRMTSKP